MIPRPAKSGALPPLPEGFTAVTQNEWLPVWDRVIASTPTKTVGYAVARFSGWADGASIRPGNIILSRMCNCSDKSVRVALGQMREWGLILRYHKGTRQGDADIYRLTLPDDALARIPLLGPNWELPEDFDTAVGATAPVRPTAAVAESDTAVAGTAALRYQVPPTSTRISTRPLYDEGKGFDLAGVEVAHAREVKTESDDPADFEDHRRRTLEVFAAWMQENPEAS